MADIRTFFANAFETTLTAEFGPTALSFQVEHPEHGPDVPAHLVLDPDNPAGREYILVSGTSSGGYTIDSISDRYLAWSAQSSGLTHAIGTVVKQAPVAQMFEDLHDRVETKLSTVAHTKALHDALGISHSSLAGRGADDHPQYLNLTRHDTTARHGANVVNHGNIGGLAGDHHPQYLTNARHANVLRHGANVVHHSNIGGLGNDDHSQYLTTVRHDRLDRHHSGVVNHAYIGGLTGDHHPQYLTNARHDRVERHGASVVKHGNIGDLGGNRNHHPQYAWHAGPHPAGIRTKSEGAWSVDNRENSNESGWVTIIAADSLKPARNGNVILAQATVPIEILRRSQAFVGGVPQQKYAVVRLLRNSGVEHTVRFADDFGDAGDPAHEGTVHLMAFVSSTSTANQTWSVQVKAGPRIRARAVVPYRPRLVVQEYRYSHDFALGFT